MISFIDLAPTILELTKTVTNHKMEGFFIIRIIETMFLLQLIDLTNIQIEDVSRQNLN